jgi:hypothetical protein
MTNVPLSRDSRSPGFPLMAIVAGLLFLAAGFVAVQVAPVLECPECNGGRAAIFTLSGQSPGTAVAGCPTCNDLHRVTLIRKWKYEKAQELR